jgi:hypothetical protein
MEDLIKKIDKLLRRDFPGARTDLEPLPDDGKITGFLYWDGFEGHEQIDRQNRVWRVLRAGLTTQQMRKVSAIFTLTPLEIAAIRAG